MKHSLLSLFIVIIFSGCASVTQPIAFTANKVVTSDSYNLNKLQNGVVLLDVNWGRFWGCGSYENAQLRSITFDKMPLKNHSNEAIPDFVLKNPVALIANPVFLNYAYTLPAGEMRP